MTMLIALRIQLFQEGNEGKFEINSVNDILIFDIQKSFVFWDILFFFFD